MGAPVTRDDEYYRCLCNTHVHKGTFILSIIGIVMNAPMIFGVSQAGNGWYFGVTSGINIISLLTYVCLLIGNRKEVPFLYFPFLIINTLILVLLVFFSIGMFVVAGLSFNGKITQKDKETETAFGVIGLFFGIYFIVILLVQAYFLHVIYRGYRYLKDVLLDPSSNLPRLH